LRSFFTDVGLSGATDGVGLADFVDELETGSTFDNRDRDSPVIYVDGGKIFGGPVGSSDDVDNRQLVDHEADGLELLASLPDHDLPKLRRDLDMVFSDRGDGKVDATR